jgi:hypothetical protein
VSAIADAMGGLLEVVAYLVDYAREERPSPRRGMLLRSRRTVRLSGRDLAAIEQSVGFEMELPPGTVVRVEELRSLDRGSLWVCPVDSALLEKVPSPQRLRARVHGYVLEIAPGNLKRDFH